MPASAVRLAPRSPSPPSPDALPPGPDPLVCLPELPRPRRRRAEPPAPPSPPAAELEPSPPGRASRTTAAAALDAAVCRRGWRPTMDGPHPHRAYGTVPPPSPSPMAASSAAFVAAAWDAAAAAAEPRFLPPPPEVVETDAEVDSAARVASRAACVSLTMPSASLSRSSSSWPMRPPPAALSLGMVPSSSLPRAGSDKVSLGQSARRRSAHATASSWLLASSPSAHDAPMGPPDTERTVSRARRARCLAAPSVAASPRRRAARRAARTAELSDPPRLRCTFLLRAAARSAVHASLAAADSSSRSCAGQRRLGRNSVKRSLDASLTAVETPSSAPAAPAPDGGPRPAVRHHGLPRSSA